MKKNLKQKSDADIESVWPRTYVDTCHAGVSWASSTQWREGRRGGGIIPGGELGGATTKAACLLAIVVIGIQTTVGGVCAEW